MSSTNKTTNLKMHSWVRTDPVVCEDFNENFNKIDAAIGEAQASYGGCEIYTGEYVGTGARVHSMTFPKLPVLLLVRLSQTATAPSIGYVRDGWYYTGVSTAAMMSVSGSTITFNSNSEENPAINKLNTKYHYIAFAHAKQ